MVLADSGEGEKDYAVNSKLEIAAKAQPCSKLASSWPWPSPGSHFASEGGSSLGTYVCLWEAELQTQGLGPGRWDPGLHGRCDLPLGCAGLCKVFCCSQGCKPEACVQMQVG